MELRNYIARLALQLEGRPYRWAGNGPGSFDCSGFVLWVLRPFGLAPRHDSTAQGLFDYYEETVNPKPGDLMFFGRNERNVTHVMLYLGDGKLIGADNGDRGVTTLESALLRSACVRICPVGYRNDPLGYRDVTQRRQA